ncbi:MAG: DUF3754 domain-containing protein [Alphaproteobacteria bacterium]|nr:DUF3754 domain-containing protein [Alphaproteobacteria bacterium]
MAAHGDENGTSVDGRHQFIPVQKQDLIEALAATGHTGQEQKDFRTFCGFLASYYHHSFYSELTELKDLHAWFAPHGPKPIRRKPMDLETAYLELIATFENVMTQAAFVEIPPDQVEALGGEHPLLDVKTRTPMDKYQSVRIFCRGQTSQTIERRGRLGRKGVATIADVFDDVVILVRFKPEAGDDKKARLSWNADARSNLSKPGTVLIKYFRNISRPELPMLLPDVRVVMKQKDMLLLGGPALLGGVPILLNIIPALSVLLVVAGAYLGYKGVVTQDQMTKAVGAMSALVGAGAFMFRQYSNYSHRKLRYQKELADNIYFKNVNNDAGVFETLIGAAEEQETKEALLAFHFLLMEGPFADADSLDKRIEEWLMQTFDVDIDFEVSDALGKLERLGLLTHENGQIGTVPLTEALIRLDSLWDQLYDFKRPAQTAAA